MGGGALSDPIPFATPADWHAWLATHQAETEVWVLYHKKGSGLPSIDWQQAVVEALCWGWIDGVRKTLNDTQWVQRFTPRRPGSSWSQINTASAERLIAEGRMQPRGLAAVTVAKANGQWLKAYSFGKGADLPQDFLAAVAADLRAAEALKTLDTRNRSAVYYRLITAKRPETRAKRIADFVTKLAAGQTIL